MRIWLLKTYSVSSSFRSFFFFFFGGGGRGVNFGEESTLEGLYHDSSECCRYSSWSSSWQTWSWAACEVGGGGELFLTKWFLSYKPDGICTFVSWFHWMLPLFFMIQLLTNLVLGCMWVSSGRLPSRMKLASNFLLKTCLNKRKFNYSCKIKFMNPLCIGKNCPVIYDEFQKKSVFIKTSSYCIYLEQNIVMFESSFT